MHAFTQLQITAIRIWRSKKFFQISIRSAIERMKMSRPKMGKSAYLIVCQIVLIRNNEGVLLSTSVNYIQISQRHLGQRRLIENVLRNSRLFFGMDAFSLSDSQSNTFNQHYFGSITNCCSLAQ